MLKLDKTTVAFLAGGAAIGILGYALYGKLSANKDEEPGYFMVDEAELAKSVAKAWPSDISVTSGTDKPDIGDLYLQVMAEYGSDDVTGDGLRRIDEESYKSSNGYSKLTATYFVLDDILAGYNDELEEIDHGEVGEENLEALVGDGHSDAVYLRDDANEIDIEIVRSEGNWLEEYEKSIRLPGDSEE